LFFLQIFVALDFAASIAGFQDIERLLAAVGGCRASAPALGMAVIMVVAAVKNKTDHQDHDEQRDKPVERKQNP
jgi:hypothetical protein